MEIYFRSRHTLVASPDPSVVKANNELYGEELSRNFKSLEQINRWEWMNKKEKEIFKKKGRRRNFRAPRVRKNYQNTSPLQKGELFFSDAVRLFSYGAND